MSELNWDKLGMTRTKDAPRLFDVRLHDYQAAVDWLKKLIARRGYIVLDVELDAYVGVWMFHVEDSAVRVEHDLVQRLENALSAMEMHEIMRRGKRKKES